MLIADRKMPKMTAENASVKVQTPMGQIAEKTAKPSVVQAILLTVRKLVENFREKA